MLEKIRLLKEWISSQQVVPKFRNRSEDDLTTLVNQLEIEAKKLLENKPAKSNNLPPIVYAVFGGENTKDYALLGVFDTSQGAEAAIGARWCTIKPVQINRLFPKGV